jgi:hypothetical protein
MTTNCVVAWLQENDLAEAEAGSPLPDGANDRVLDRAQKGFSYAKVGEFSAGHPGAVLPELAADPAAQTSSPGWTNPVMAHAAAWRELWTMVDRGFFYTASTGMHLVEEAGLQTLLASVLVGCPRLLGGGVRLLREAPLRGSQRNGPIEFAFRTTEGAVTAVIEAKTTRRLTTEYARSVEQLYAEMFAAWEHNASIGKDGLPVTGVLVAAGGGVTFTFSASAFPESQNGPAITIECSKYMYVFQDSMPGFHMDIWLNGILAAALPECRDWDADTWAARKAACTLEEDEWRRQFGSSIFSP